MLTRAYSTLHIKSIDDDKRIVEGIASSPVIDRDGDIMEPGGAEYKLPMPLLWMHRQDEPIGVVTSATVTKTGIKIRAQIGKDVSPEVDRAWALIKSGLARGFSIGSRLIEYSRIADTGGIHVQKWNWLETSVVTIPANQDASITAIKSYDAQNPPVSGGRSSQSITRPGVTGSHRTGPPIMTNQEKLTKAKSDLETKTARLQEIVDLDEPSVEEAQEQSTLTKEIGALTSTVDTLTALEKALGSQATVAAPQPRQQATTEKKADVKVVELEKGIRFARVAMAVAAGKGSISDTLQYARKWDGQTPEVSKFIKEMFSKAVAGTATFQSPGWGSELVYVNNVAGEMIELLRNATIIDRIQGFRRGVFNTRMVKQTSGATIGWVGEGAVKPVTSPDFDTVTLPFHKMAGIVVLTQELVRLSSPDAEMAVRDDLVAQIARFKDAQFIDPTVSATSAHPASITNGVSAPNASAATAAAFFYDINAALATFDNNPNTENLTILMTPALARGLSTLQNVNGGFVFPSLGAKGGTIMGYTVIVSGSVPSGTIIILNPADILLAQDGSVALDASSEATLDLAGGSTPNVSLWQRNMIGIRAELACTWLKVRSDSVAMIDTASYGPAAA